jgi:hypothetical protein
VFVLEVGSSSGFSLRIAGLGSSGALSWMGGSWWNGGGVGGLRCEMR